MRRTEFSLEATNLQSLMRQLRSVGRYLGPRSGLNKRSKEDKELFCLRRYIATVAAKRQWDYPCAVNTGESPDFMIKFGNLNQGLEIREAATEVFQRELTALQRQSQQAPPYTMRALEYLQPIRHRVGCLHWVLGARNGR
jgi:hypothetical protein